MVRYAFTPRDHHVGPSEPASRVCDVREAAKDKGPRTLLIELDGQTHLAQVLCETNPFLVIVNQQPLEVYEHEGRYTALRTAATFDQARTRNTNSRASQESSKTVLAPMPGKVVRVLCRLGNIVEAGSPLVVLEAMKMENELCAARAGRVKAIFVSEGQAVESRAKLLEFD